jgi:hypothetical protein
MVYLPGDSEENHEKIDQEGRLTDFPTDVSASYINWVFLARVRAQN